MVDLIFLIQILAGIAAVYLALRGLKVRQEIDELVKKNCTTQVYYEYTGMEAKRLRFVVLVIVLLLVITALCFPQIL